MSQLTKIKQKIKSIKTTKKITHAIRLVSMSSYSRLEKQKLVLEKYQSNVAKIFEELIQRSPDWKSKLLFPNDILDTTPLTIIVSSTKGLCGSFNSNLERYLERNFFTEDHQTPTIITIGKKAKKMVLEKNLGNILYSYSELTMSNFVTIANDLSEKIISKDKPYSSVSFFSNKLKNFFVQRPKKTTIIPGNLDSIESNESEEFDPIWEQETEEILNNLANKYIKSSILEILFQSLIAENASRFLAMDGSTSNASKYIDKLTVQHNKTRQTLITREVSELSANM